MNIKFIDGEWTVKNYCFSSPTTGSMGEDVPSSMYYFCLNKKIAALIDKDRMGNSRVSIRKIRIRRGILYINYEKDNGKTFEKAGKVSQGKYQTLMLEKALFGGKNVRYTNGNNQEECLP